MPCKPQKARKLLRNGKAKVIRREPFTIQLLYGSSGYRQHVTLGVDAGSKHIGLSATTSKKELFAGEVKLRTDIVNLLSTRRQFRRSRRSRKTRYRKSRFLNRVHSKHKGWLAPSIENKIQCHLSIVDKLHKILPIDKVIGRIYPVFGAALLFMAVALCVMLCVKMPNLPEVWDSLDNMMPQEAAEANPIYPCLFITIACGAISGFHATQSPMMARCIATERHGRRVFYGAMITEGIVALIWAAVGSYFFYASPTPGYQEMEVATGYATAAPKIVALVTQDWLGLLGGILAVMGVIVAPITTGDTALRSARLIVADWLKIDQRQKAKRLYISIPIFLFSLLLLLWQIENPEGFNVIWQYFGWGNQVLSVIGLWTITVYLAGENKCYWVTLLPAMFMTCVCITFLCVSKQAFAIDYTIGCIAGVTAMAATTILFFTHLAKKRAIK